MAASSDAEKFETQRRKLMFRSWHRGTREMDLILGRFATAWLPRLTNAELDEYQRLLECPDGELLEWILDTARVPEEWDGEVLRRLRRFHAEPRF